MKVFAVPSLESIIAYVHNNKKIGTEIYALFKESIKTMTDISSTSFFEEDVISEGRLTLLKIAKKYEDFTSVSEVGKSVHNATVFFIRSKTAVPLCYIVFVYPHETRYRTNNMLPGFYLTPLVEMYNKLQESPREKLLKLSERTNCRLLILSISSDIVDDIVQKKDKESFNIMSNAIVAALENKMKIVEIKKNKG